MGQFKLEAILLAVRNWDDADRMVTLFSREQGKMTAMAYGARRPKSQLSGTVQPFVHAELVLTPGKNISTIRQCAIKNPFRPLREELTQMAYATFLAELAAELWPEREAEPAVFELLLAAFTLMSARNPRITALACALQLMALGGFRPECRLCVTCGQTLTYPARFDVRAGGVVCPGCSGVNCQEYSEDVNQLVEKLLQLDWQNPGQFSVVGAVLLQTERLVLDFIMDRLDKPLKSMAFLATVTGSDKKEGPREK
ncbi:MAG: DNA repair protein RecO [Negativicutes bacterium]|nr:DNA repair protein RecO [Negativicutes bacterium]